MAAETVSKLGRPVGTRTATVELETVSFKAPAELLARVRTYAKAHRQSVSELVRDGLEWRISDESDPRSWQPGAETSGETVYGGNTGNTDTAQLRLMLQQELRAFFAHAEGVMDVIRKAEHVSTDGDLPAASMKAQSTLGQAPAGEDMREGMPPYDPAKRKLGKLCPGEHEWGTTGQTLLRLPSLTCPLCEAASKRDRRKAKREAQPVAG